MVNVDVNLKRAVLDIMMGGDKLSYCFQCGKCNDVCPVSMRWGSRYNPRDLVLFSALGFKDALVSAVVKDPFVLWGCAACETCDEKCPAEIPITDIICMLKNVATSLGVVPPYYPDSVKTTMDNGMVIPVQAAITKRREKLGLAEAPKIPVDAIKAIMAATGIESVIKKEGTA